MIFAERAITAAEVMERSSKTRVVATAVATGSVLAVSREIHIIMRRRRGLTFTIEEIPQSLPE
jgi:hypothetical protein